MLPSGRYKTGEGVHNEYAKKRNERRIHTVVTSFAPLIKRCASATALRGRPELTVCCFASANRNSSQLRARHPLAHRVKDRILILIIRIMRTRFSALSVSVCLCAFFLCCVGLLLMDPASMLRAVDFMRARERPQKITS